ncbi:sulfurtransferase [Microbispora sp. SCL1-1]|uniref:thiosulfate sulfurtransferase n=1 Tax=Microbispora hainanensis TaxID=568844 RepID=A0ABZ1SKN0_9ACTN|nr:MULTISPECIES: sulfurtransferase [Microbispora]NJP27812.1 sulfurtransferase [Microbispora sp. CL1-1]TQS10579.1 sulfurtransferase [Microbispora sp. SCL1-1]
MTFIGTAELAARLTDPGVRIVDVRWRLDDPEAGARAYADGHIPGAVYLSWLRDLSDEDDPVEGQLATPEAFARVLGAAGIGPDTTVVAYDDGTIYMAARLVWALRQYGHADAHVLDGGLPAWLREDRPVTAEVPAPEPRTYPVPGPRDLRVTKHDVLAALGTGDVTIADCRMDETYRAAGAHIPGAVRFPAPALFAEGGLLRAPSEIAELAERAGIVRDRPTILYCGGGVSASAAFLALREIGFDRLTVYDGSWSEWSADPATPKESHSA